MSESRKFKAFLSYSRQDEPAVKRLHRRLESYVIPRALRRDGAARLGRFFRDKDELAAAAELGTALEAKLNSAQWLIVCCSSAAARSKWVNAEVEAFARARGDEWILAVVLEGEPQDSFPPALREREPLAADFRSTGDGEQMGFLQLVAGLIGVDLGELRDREAAAERARMRLRAILASVFFILAVAAGVGAVIAIQQRDRAEAMAREAIDIGAGVVAQTDELSRRFGVPTSALERLLNFASTRFDRLFAEGVQSQELARQRAGLRVQFAEFYGRAGDAEKQRAEAQTALAMFERFPPGELRSLDYIRALAAAGQAELTLGREREAAGYTTRAIEAARSLRADIPDGRLGRIWLAGSLQRLGEIHMLGGRPREALPLFAEAVALTEWVRAQTPDDDIAVSNNITALDWLGGAQSMTGDRTAAKATFAQTATAARAWSLRDPESLSARSSLGSSLMKLGQTLADEGDFAAARPPLEESLAIARALVASDDSNATFKSDLALRMMLTANVLNELGQPSDTLSTEAIAMARAQVIANPADSQAKETLARMLAVRAARQSKGGQHQAARTTWREIVELRRAMRADALARTPASAAQLAYAHELIGDVSADLRDLPAMLAAYGQAVPLRREVLASAPQNKEALASLAAVLHAQGLTKKFNSDETGAIAALSEAAQIRTALAEADREDRAIAFSAVDSLQQLALLQAAGDGAVAKRSLERAKSILERLVAAEPNNDAYADSLQRTDEVIVSIEGDER